MIKYPTRHSGGGDIVQTATAPVARIVFVRALTAATTAPPPGVVHLAPAGERAALRVEDDVRVSLR